MKLPNIQSFNPEFREFFQISCPDIYFVKIWSPDKIIYLHVCPPPIPLVANIEFFNQKFLMQNIVWSPKIRIMKIPWCFIWAFPADLEKVVNCPQTENLEIYNLFKIA